MSKYNLAKRRGEKDLSLSTACCEVIVLSGSLGPSSLGQVNPIVPTNDCAGEQKEQWP